MGTAISTDYSPKAFFSVKDLTVAVTGAGGQIGGEIVAACLAGGARVVASDADPEALQSRAVDAGWPEDRVIRTVCDVRDRSQVIDFFALGTQVFGSIEALVNNAGVSVFEPFMERKEESIDWVMDVNLKGTFWCIQQFIERRRAQGGGGCIVNIASHYGIVSPDPRIYADDDRRSSEIYGATKAGIIQMTKYFAVNAARDDVRVNAVAPGGVRNPWKPQGKEFQENYSFRCPQGRMAELHEVVGAVVYLLSPAATYVNGHTLVVDGGMTAW